MKKIHDKLNQLYLQKEKIEEEIRALELQLSQQSVKKGFTKEKKIEIFKSLFICREDIYAKKWISKDGTKQGFYPVTQTFKGEDYLPLNNNEIELHLRGMIQLASYVIDSNNSCKYIILEILDEDKFKLQIALNSLNIRAYYELSSYNSLLVWVFFEENLSAKVSKSLASYILEKANVSGKTYPKEEFSNKGRLGSSVELPLHLKFRDKNQTVFLDINTSKIYEDQWSVLAHVQKVPKELILKLVENNSYEITPTQAFEQIVYPKFELKLVIYDFLYIPTKDLSKTFLNKLKGYASFDNPQIKVLLGLRKPLYNTPRVIKNFEQDERYLKLPRGVIYKVLELFEENKIKYKIEDKNILKKLKLKKLLLL